jgi:hypothetical protein
MFASFKRATVSPFLEVARALLACLILFRNSFHVSSTQCTTSEMRFISGEVEFEDVVTR